MAEPQILLVVAVAVVAGKSPGQPTLAPFFTPTSTTEESMVGVPVAGTLCAKCGRRGHSQRMREPNCCSDGGAWEHMCDGGGPHTWEDGLNACKEGSAVGESSAKHGESPSSATRGESASSAKHVSANGAEDKGWGDDAYVVCAKCGRQSSSAEKNCCSSGGSWQGMCGDGGSHTWTEGHVACKESSAIGESAPDKHAAVNNGSETQNASGAHAKGELGNEYAVCAKCGRQGQRHPNCCSTGGTWEGMCGDGGSYTLSEGYAACKDEPATTWLSTGQLSKLFLSGIASNNLSEVGLIFHGFDTPTDSTWSPYKPCTEGYCAQFKKWWPASIINARQRHTFANTGIILSPMYNRVLCSFYADASTTNAQTGRSCAAMNGRMFKEDCLKDMLNISMRDDMKGTAPKMKGYCTGNMTGRCTGYNEVVLDSPSFLKNLPGSVAAVVYGLHGTPHPLWCPEDSCKMDEARAFDVYRGFLDAYSLSTADVPLLKANFDSASTAPLTGAMFTDESAKAVPRLSRDNTVRRRDGPPDRMESRRRWHGIT